MRRLMLHSTPVLMTVVLATGIAAADGPSQADYDALLGRVTSLQAEVDQLKAQDGDDWLTEKRAEEVRLLVHDVLADADTRTSLLQNGASSGYDNGFFIQSADGNNKLVINALLQARFVLNSQRDSPIDDTRWGFEIPRAKLIFSGNFIDPTWVYRLEGQWIRDTGAFQLLDAYIGHAFGDSGWTGLAGQFKVPMLRETLVYSEGQLFVERSLLGQEFSAGRAQGVAADWRNDQFHVVGGWTNGHPATSGGTNTPWSRRDTEFALSGRFEWLASGTWGQFADFQGWRDDETAIMVGAAVHYEQGEYGTIDDETKVFQWTVDFSAEFSGANVFAYVVGRNVNGLTTTDEYGFLVQGGYFITDDWELYARYEWGDDDSGGDNLSIITFGANKYFARNNLKWSTDIGIGLNPVTAHWADGTLGEGGDITGWRTDSANKDGQVVFRTQMQMFF